MKRTVRVIQGLAATAALVLAGCAVPGSGGNNSGGTATRNVVSNDITSPTEWKAGNVYYINPSNEGQLEVDALLTIDAGAIVKFGTDKAGLGDGLHIGSGGVIKSNGTAKNPVIFTSILDDANGGDTNGDGNATVPAAGDWDYIETDGQNSSTFTYTDFLYGGANSMYPTALLIDNGSTGTSVTYCTFAHDNGGSPDPSNGDAGALDAEVAGTGTTIQNNTFYDDQTPLSIGPTVSIDDSNTFHSPIDVSPAEPNKYNVISFYGWDSITGPVTWAAVDGASSAQNSDVAFYIQSYYGLFVDDSNATGAKLTLGANVVVKTLGGTITLAHATSEADTSIMVAGSTNYFTSYRDDTVGGDSDADSASVTPTSNDWHGIEDYASGTFISQLKYQNVSYESDN